MERNAQINEQNEFKIVKVFSKPFYNHPFIGDLKKM